MHATSHLDAGKLNQVSQSYTYLLIEIPCNLLGMHETHTVPLTSSILLLSMNPYGLN